MLTHQLTGFLTEQLNTLIGQKALCVNILEISAAVPFLLITVSFDFELEKRSADPLEKLAKKPNRDEHAKNEHEPSHRKQGHNTA